MSECHLLRIEKWMKKKSSEKWIIIIVIKSKQNKTINKQISIKTKVKKQRSNKIVCIFLWKFTITLALSKWMHLGDFFTYSFSGMWKMDLLKSLHRGIKTLGKLLGKKDTKCNHKTLQHFVNDCLSVQICIWHES
jgi:hypothetical protein